MRLTELALLYSVVGVGCALAFLVARRRSSPAALALDAALLAPFWPLYGPFLLLRRLEPEGGRSHSVDGPLHLSSLLPDDGTARALEERLDLARRRVVEIDELLADPDFDEAETLERVGQLESRGDHRAAATARGRAAGIRRLRGLRSRFDGELAEIAEILAQLKVQAEVVRLAGESDRSSSEGLLDELRLRLETLDEMLACTSVEGV